MIYKLYTYINTLFKGFSGPSLSTQYVDGFDDDDGTYDQKKKLPLTTTDSHRTYITIVVVVVVFFLSLTKYADWIYARIFTSPVPFFLRSFYFYSSHSYHHNTFSLGTRIQCTYIFNIVCKWYLYITSR